ncbi:hypothetical protein NE236_30965 [Actinoallomurus purpureus]|nr:hypothetical protein [Actinoallomurus purpureus]MCO6009401.1 hypothetical protein [Actinoallomurus purpureus]
MIALEQVDAARPVAEIAVRPMGEHEDPLTRYRCLLRAELCAALRS